MVGGDRREQEMAHRAAATGATVRCFGFPWPEEGIAGIVPSPSAAAALEEEHFGPLPIPGRAADGALFAPASREKIVVDAFSSCR
jgi:dipicolinate synthase subunit A